MEDFDYFGSNFPAQNGDAEGTQDWEDFSETLEESDEVAKRCAIIRKKMFESLVAASK